MSIHICHCISRSCISASLSTCKPRIELNPQSTCLTISKLPPVRFWSGLSSTLVYAFTINTQQITGILIFVLGFSRISWRICVWSTGRSPLRCVVLNRPRGNSIRDFSQSTDSQKQLSIGMRKLLSQLVFISHLTYILEINLINFKC